VIADHIMSTQMKKANAIRRIIVVTSDVPTKKNGKKKNVLVPMPLLLLITKRIIPAIMTRIPTNRKF